MKIETKQIYYCDYCEKRTIAKGSMTRHEKFCNYNPINLHACFNANGQHCANLEEIKVEVEFFPYGDRELPQTTTVTKYHCKVLDKMLHSFKAVGKGLLRKYPHQFKDSELMPLRCDKQTENKDYVPMQEADTFL